MRQAFIIGQAVALEELGITKLAKKKSDEEQDMYKSPFTRALQVGTGAGIMKGNAPFVSALAKGRADLWHGTPIENMFEGKHGPGILSQGLSTEFAGKNKRLNNVLMSNALFRDTEEFMASKGVKITPEIEAKLYDVTEKFLHDQKASGLPIHEAIGKIAPQVAQEFGLNPGELGAHYQKRLPELGKRIYFGAKPEAVSFWSNAGKNEAHYIAEKIKDQGMRGTSIGEQVKIMAEGMGEQLTGGYLNDIRAKLQYGRPGTVEDVADLEALRTKLKQHLGSDVNTVFRSSVPTQSLDHLKDLPGARHLLSSLPIVKTIASRFFPQNDPSKDLSIAQNLDPKSINRAEIVDKATGRVTHRYNVGGATKAPMQFFGGAGNRLKNMRKAAIPGLLTAGGAGMIYGGLKDIDKDLGFRKKGGLQKFAKVDRATLLKSFLYPAAALAIPGGAAIGARHLMDEKLPDVPTAEKMRAMGMREQFRQASKEMEYTKKLTIPSALIGAAGGAAMGGVVGPKGTKMLASALGAYMGGNVGASYAPYMAQQNTLIKTDPEGSGLLGMVLGKRREGRDFMREHPEGISVAEQALQAGLLGGLPYFAMKKYYPYHAAKIGKGIREFTADGLAKVRAPEFQAGMKKWYIPAVGASVAMPTAINYATAAGMQHGLAAAAGEEKKGRKKVAWDLSKVAIDLTVHSGDKSKSYTDAETKAVQERRGGEGRSRLDHKTQPLPVSKLEPRKRPAPPLTASQALYKELVDNVTADVRSGLSSKNPTMDAKIRQAQERLANMPKKRSFAGYGAALGGALGGLAGASNIEDKDEGIDAGAKVIGPGLLGAGAGYAGGKYLNYLRGL